MRRAISRFLALLRWTVLITLATSFGPTAQAQAPEPSRPQAQRRQILLDRGWRFTFDTAMTDAQALAADGSRWEQVTIPHSWNAHDAANTHAAAPYKRGIGWYRLEFDTPVEGARRWLQFDAASEVAEVWINGAKVGDHAGAFSAFRVDVTSALLVNGRNVLLVKVDNREPTKESDRTAIAPIVTGDFNVSGGLYRPVSLVLTADPVHFDLNHFGGSGVYGATTSAEKGRAALQVRTRLTNDSREDGTFQIRVALLDAGGAEVARAERSVTVEQGETRELPLDLAVRQPHLWQGVEDPYLYRLVAQVAGRNGRTLDEVSQPFGIRVFRFDPARGLFLNGKHVRLRGAAMHQDYPEKAWAISPSDTDESMAFYPEMGANAVRLAHYQNSQHTLDRADDLGLVVWSEIPVYCGTVIPDVPITSQGNKPACVFHQASSQFVDNAGRQLREMIYQLYNHPSIAMWSVGNETTFVSKSCLEPYDNVTPVLRELNRIARKEDPHRVTAYADFTEPPVVTGPYIKTGGITDILGRNQYPYWYEGPPLVVILDAIHARYPKQPLGMTEYGAGAAISHHTDNPLGGPPESTNTGQETVYQPEEYAAWVHEQDWRDISSRSFLWGTFIWTMFDFGSAGRHEGDVVGVNTKGLVTFDRKTRKDAFYFYKANWNPAPTTWIVGRRYTDRAYPVVDVKVYSNADRVALAVNGGKVGELKKGECPQATCLFKGVRLTRGNNTVAATGSHSGREVTDTVQWSFNRDGLYIAAGQLTTGFASGDGTRYGSDDFFDGGAGNALIAKSSSGVTDATPPRGTKDQAVFQNYREGKFAYDLPLDDGEYRITLGFLEPNASTLPGDRVFDVLVNGQPAIRGLDVLGSAGAYRTAISRSFSAKASGSRLRIEFRPTKGEAVVSNLAIRRGQGSTPQNDQK